jgi:hypothetical protein
MDVSEGFVEGVLEELLVTRNLRFSVYFWSETHFLKKSFRRFQSANKNKNYFIFLQ